MFTHSDSVVDTLLVDIGFPQSPSLRDSGDNPLVVLREITFRGLSDEKIFYYFIISKKNLFLFKGLHARSTGMAGNVAFLRRSRSGN